MCEGRQCTHMWKTRMIASFHQEGMCEPIKLVEPSYLLLECVDFETVLIVFLAFHFIGTFDGYGLEELNTPLSTTFQFCRCVYLFLVRRKRA